MHDHHELAGMSLFADLSPAEIEKAGQAFEEQWFEPGERAQRQGMKGSGFHVILGGQAKWALDGGGNGGTSVESRPVALKRGDWFGELGILFDEEAPADVVATEPLHCIVLPGRDLRSFLYQHPDVMFRLLLGEARRVRDGRWHR